MLSRSAAAVTAAVALTATPAVAQALKPGDRAPDFGSDVTWIKGDAVPKFEKGHAYVLDFWATWCGPCVASIPHINEMAQQYKDQDVHVIGVAVWPRPGMVPTDEYVANRGDEMNYRIAEDVDGRIARRYMEATNSQGIPTAMVIDRNGRLAWVGHPAGGLDDVVAQVASGSYDVEAAARRAGLMSQADTLRKRAEQAAQAGDWDTALEKLEEVVSLDPEQFAQFSVVKFQVMLAQLGRTEAAYEYARTRMMDVISKEWYLLANVAGFIVEAPGIAVRDYDFALEAAEKANKVAEGKEVIPLHAIASVYFAKGEMDKAVSWQEKAVAASGADDKPRMEAKLEEYKAASKG